MKKMWNPIWQRKPFSTSFCILSMKFFSGILVIVASMSLGSHHKVYGDGVLRTLEVWDIYWRDATYLKIGLKSYSTTPIHLYTSLANNRIGSWEQIKKVIYKIEKMCLCWPRWPPSLMCVVVTPYVQNFFWSSSPPLGTWPCWGPIHTYMCMCDEDLYSEYHL